MIPVTTYKGKHVAVFGLGRSGLATARALRDGGALVSAWDDGKLARHAAEKDQIPLVDLYEADISHIETMVISPGIPLTHPKPHPLVLKAADNGLEILGDVELFAREVDAFCKTQNPPRVICVTGTNGKSTTTALITHMLAQSGFHAHAGGNLGEPVLALPSLRADRFYVLELSSYQLDLIKTLKPAVSVFLNISTDHLDRHGDMDGYVAAKIRIFQNQDTSDHAVIGVDDSYSQSVCTRVSSKGGPTVLPISVGKALGKGAYVIDGILYDGTKRPSATVADLRQAKSLPGVHNWQNAAAAYAVVRQFVDDEKALGQSVISFPGLAHRLERLGGVGAVEFVNDSKATNAEATSHALEVFDNIYWIAGGVAKKGGINTLAEQFSKIKKAYLIGEAAETFSDTLGDSVSYKKCKDLKQATTCALHDAMEDGGTGAVVLLSPACASFDQFKNFEDRGDAYRQIVSDLLEKLPVKKSGKETAA